MNKKLKHWLLIGVSEIILSLILIATAPTFLNSKKPIFGFLIWFTVPTVLVSSSVYAVGKLTKAHQARKIFVTECTQKRFPTIVIQDVSLLSPLRLPPDIQKSIDEQFAAQQAAQTAEANRRKVEAESAANTARAKGEAQITIERARAEAEANRLRATSITPQLLELEKLQIQRERIQKWNGNEPHTVIQSPNVQVSGKK